MTRFLPTVTLLAAVPAACAVWLLTVGSNSSAEADGYEKQMLAKAVVGETRTLIVEYLRRASLG